VPNIEVGDYTLAKEDVIVVDAAIPPSLDLDFQNPISICHGTPISDVRRTEVSSVVG
jgi:hypothetical protein